jgi:hypothetical protein
MIRRFGSGYFAVTVEISRPTYTRRTVLKTSEEGNYEIVKQQTEPPATEWTCYSYVSEGKEIAFVRGYFVSKERFHIQRIKNILKDRRSGYKGIPKILKVLEEDLKSQGVRFVTTSSLLKWAPIAMRRYGFSAVDGQTPEALRRSWLRWIPALCKPLKKEL